MGDIPETGPGRVDLRMTPAPRQTLQRAAPATSKTLTRFLPDMGLDAPRARAARGHAPA